jgi:hypothetical protein
LEAIRFCVLKMIRLSLVFLILFPSALYAAQVSLAWDPNTETDLAGYKIYIGYAPRSYSWSMDAGKQTQGTVTNLEDGSTFYMALTAYNTAGLESGFSNEVTYATPAGAQTTLTVSRTGTGAGTVSATGITCGTDCSEVYTTGSSVTLTATPNSGSTFGGWGGACSGTAGTCTVAMSANRTVTATFTDNTAPTASYALTVSKLGTGSGTVSNSPAGSSFPAGTAVTLTATPGAGSTFGGWGGACSGTAGTCTVTMSAARTVTATFTAGTYTITASAGANGSITPSGATAVAYGGSQTYTIRAASGYQVKSVTVDGSPVGGLSSYTFNNVKGNHSISATFTRVVYSSTNRTLKISKIGSGNGLVTTSPSGTVFKAGTEVTLTVVPEDGSTFVEWSGACSGNEPSCKVVLNTNMSVTATFEILADTGYKVYLPIMIQ